MCIVENIKVSIIMPVYNSGKYLKTAVESILNQSLREIELILVDDGSSDGSAECCDEWTQKDNRVKVIHQKNGGICAARNAGLKIASGEYIGFSDHDDSYGEGQLKDNYELIKKSKADIIKFGSREIITVGDKKIRDVIKHLNDGLYTTENIKNEFWLLWRQKVFDSVWDVLFNREFLKSHQIIFDNFYKAGGEDFDFLWHCVGQGASLQVNSRTYYCHYLRTGFSTSMKYNSYNEKMILERPQKLLDLISPLNIDINLHKIEYSYWWLQLVLGALCHTLGHPQCKWSHQDKIKVIRELSNKDYYRDWIVKNVKFSELVKIAPKQYILLQILYRFHLYGLCLILYKLQYKFNGIN